MTELGANRRSVLSLLAGFCRSERRKPGKLYPFDTSAAKTDISHPISNEPPDVCPEGPEGAEEWLNPRGELMSELPYSQTQEREALCMLYCIYNIYFQASAVNLMKNYKY